MAEYTAPLRDMKFVIKELIGLEAVSSLPGCEEVAPDLVDAVLEEAGKFATGVLSPLNWARRPPRLQAAGRRGHHAARVQGRLPSVPRGRLAGVELRSALRRSGLAVPAGPQRVGDLERGEHELLPRAHAHQRRSPRRRAPRHRRAQAALSAQARIGRVDGHHEPHRAAGRLGPVRGARARRARRRSLPHLRDQDLHHLRRARLDRQRRAPGARAAAGRARRA